MRNMIAGFVVVLALVVSGCITDTANAQEVPVLGENGWILPENDDSSFDGGPVAAAPSVPNGIGGYGPMVDQWRPAVEEACAYYGCNPDQLLRVIRCESGGNPNAQGAGGELGILQVKPHIWGQMTSVEQIWFAAQDFADGVGNKWVCQGNY